MADPQRLLSGISDGDDLERELLASIQRMDPPADAKAEGWARLSAQIAAVGLVSSAHGSAAASTGAATQTAAAVGSGSTVGVGPAALKLLTSKLAVALALTGTAIGVSAVWVHVSTSHQTSVAPSAAAPRLLEAASASASAPAAIPQSPDPAVQLSPEPDSAAKPAPSVDQHRQDMLSAESALLTAARAQLRNGDAASAQQTLIKLRTQFPRGMLSQEREVLAIEVLAARGKTDAARRRAQAFISAYPESPHSAQLSRFADAP